jgi:hypothetical protein
MRILLDECVDRRLGREIAGHSVASVAEMGWVGIVNGELLQRAAAEFDVLVTVDRNLPFQQHLPKYPIAVLLIEARSNRLVDLVAQLPKLLAILPTVEPGIVTRVGL